MPSSAAGPDQTFTDPMEGRLLGDIVRVDVQAAESGGTYLSVFVEFNGVVEPWTFRSDYLLVVGIDLNNDGESDFLMVSGEKELRGVAEVLPIITVPGLGDSGCDASFYGFTETKEKYVGFTFDAKCLGLKSKFGMGVAMVDAHNSNYYDSAPDDDLYSVNNPFADPEIPVTDVPVVTGGSTTAGVLTAVPGKWTENTEFSYQWLLDGVPIPEAFEKTYRPLVSQIGKSISVKVIGDLLGYTSVIKYSSATVVKSAAFLSTPTPTILGSLKLGSTVVAKPGPWAAGTAFKYQWYLNGKPIKGASRSSYKISKSDKGKKLSVGVTATKKSFTTVTIRSKEKLVG